MNCKDELIQIYVKCAECIKVQLCMQCFSSGQGPNEHQKTHKYSIVDNGSFSLFDPEWTASEEHILIDSVEQYGLGNWEDVGDNLPMKRVKDVENHYHQVYIDGYLGRITVPEDIPNR